MASNGRTLQRSGPAVRGGSQDPSLATWIEDRGPLPEQHGRPDRAGRHAGLARPCSRLLGLRDEAAVSTEGFAQWVIEDDFAAGRPRWEAAGAELVRDVRPYQELKLRLLNGAHSAIAYLGALLGKPFVADVMADPALARFIERLMLEEIAPLTPAPPGFDVDALCPGPAAAVRRTGRCSTARCRSPWTARRRSRCAGCRCCARPGSRGLPVPTPRHGARGLALLPRRPRRGRAGAAARRPAGATSARGRGVRAPRTRRRWSGQRLRSRRCSAATCGRMRPWSTSSRPCSRGSHRPACAPPLLTDRACSGARGDARPRLPSSGLEPIAAGWSAARRPAATSRSPVEAPMNRRMTAWHPWAPWPSAWHCRPAGRSPDHAQMGARLRDVRAVPHRIGLGGGRDREAHRRSLPHRRLSGLPARQGDGPQPGPDPRERRHHRLRLELRGAQLSADRRDLLPYTFRDADHLLAYTKSDIFKELAQGYEDKTGHHIVAVTYYGTRQTSSNRPIQAAPTWRA